jgi:hypothetical protein
LVTITPSGWMANPVAKAVCQCLPRWQRVICPTATTLGLVRA